jgi:hypothetical protein
MKKLGLLLPVLVPIGLVLAACSSAPPPIVEVPRAVGLAQGIDLPTDARDVSMELKGSRLDFVARYYRDPTSRWPSLSAAEAQMVSEAGMKLVALWESHSHNPAYFSHASGYSDAMTAYRQARAIGQPAGSAIYFAVDFNAREPDIRGSVDQYFRGVTAGFAAMASSPPDYRVGVYGSGAVCDYLKQARLAQYAWLSNSTAWTGYGSFTDWNIRQGRGTLSLSFNHDWNQARDDYGGFQVESQHTSL